MAYTFGAGTGDDITFGVVGSFNSDNAMHLFMAWVKPTTLTATRGLFSLGNTTGAEIDTTTSEIRIRAATGTTAGQWTTTGVGLTVDKWTFVAVLTSQESTGLLFAHRVWAGDIDNPPAEITVTSAVAPAGTLSGNSNCYIGNKGTGTLAFQGDISDFYFIGNTVNTSPSQTGFQVTTSGVITNTEAGFIYNKYIYPAYIGDLLSGNGGSLRTTWAALTCGEIVVFTPLDETRVITAFSRGISLLTPITLTVNGATVSQDRGPVPMRKPHPFMPALVYTSR